MKLFKELREAIEKAAPKEDWKGSMNYPFDIVIEPPRSSLSKHWGTVRGQRQWHCDDGLFILRARHEVPKLLEAFDVAMDSLNKICYGPIAYDDVQGKANETLQKIKAINEQK